MTTAAATGFLIAAGIACLVARSVHEHLGRKRDPVKWLWAGDPSPTNARYWEVVTTPVRHGYRARANGFVQHGGEEMRCNVILGEGSYSPFSPHPVWFFGKSRAAAEHRIREYICEQRKAHARYIAADRERNQTSAYSSDEVCP